MQSSSHGDQLVIYNGGEDLSKLASDFLASTHPFDLWFGRQLQDITGVDFRKLSASGLPEELLTYGF